MTGYNDVVAYAYSATSVGGSDECLEAISSGHATIGEMMNGSDQDSQDLASIFNIRKLLPLKLFLCMYYEVFLTNGLLQAILRYSRTRLTSLLSLGTALLSFQLKAMNQHVVRRRVTLKRFVLS